MKRIIALSLAVVAVCLSHSEGYAQAADLILTGGKIFTSDSSQLYVEALAVRGNRIAATGSNADIEKLATDETARIDLKGRTVVPGFNDAHDHLGWHAPVGLSYTYTEMIPAGLSKEAVLDSVARLVRIARPDQWIQGFIGTTVLYDPTVRNALDEIAPNNPVNLQIWWGHGIVTNRKGLEAAGVSDDDPDPVGGWYDRAPDTGKITAIHENAQPPVWQARLSSEPENLVVGLRSFAAAQLRGGITSVQTFSSILDARGNIRAFAEADLPQRIRIIPWPRSTSQGRNMSEWNLTNTRPAPRVVISGVKYLVDGTPLEGNALSRTAYEGRPGWYGRLNYPVDTLTQILKEAATSDVQLMMHLTSDSSLSVVLSLMKEVAEESIWKDKRVRIEHNCVGPIPPPQRNALKDMGVLLMHTPVYCQGSPLRSLLEQGVIMGIAPDGTTNPFIEIMIVTSMQSDPEENLTREQAVIAYTKANAYAEFEESNKGTLKEGMLADLTVLSQDVFSVPTPQLPATSSVLTMIDGEIVYHDPGQIGVERAR